MPNEEAIKQIAKVKRLTPAQSRRLWAKASTAKRFILNMPDAFTALVSRIAAIEAALIAKEVLTTDEIGMANMAAMEGIVANPPTLFAEDWVAVEEAMLRDINKKIEKSIRETDGILKSVGAKD